MRLVEASEKGQARWAVKSSYSFLDARPPTQLFNILPAVERALLLPET